MTHTDRFEARKMLAAAESSSGSLKRRRKRRRAKERSSGPARMIGGLRARPVLAFAGA